MKKTLNPFQKIAQNLKNLIPYIGVLLVVAGIVGLVFIQKPLETSQDVRSDASENEGITGTPEYTIQLKDNLVVDEKGKIEFLLNSEGYKITQANLTFNIVNSDIENPEVFVNLESGLRATKVESEKVADGYLVTINAIPNNRNWISPTGSTTFVTLNLTPPKTGKISVNIDPDRSQLLVETGLDQIPVIPTEISYTILSERKDTSDEPDVLGCNEECVSNSDCEVGMRCYPEGDKKFCRLATNATSRSCSTTSSSTNIITANCNEYCDSNTKCKSGLTCYNSFCRNPENPQDNRCVAPTTEQAAATIQSCNESCSSNADCAINLRCYQGACRLATNVSSTSCTAATKTTVSDTYSVKATDTSTPEEIAKSDTPLKGTNRIPETEKDFQPVDDNQAERKSYDDSYAADETVLDLIKNLAQNSESRLPMFVILLGVLLLLGSIVFFLISSMKKRNANRMTTHERENLRNISVETHNVQPGKTPMTTPTSSQNVTAQNLLKKLEEEQKK